MGKSAKALIMPSCSGGELCAHKFLAAAHFSSFEHLILRAVVQNIFFFVRLKMLVGKLLRGT